MNKHIYGEPSEEGDLLPDENSSRSRSLSSWQAARLCRAYCTNVESIGKDFLTRVESRALLHDPVRLADIPAAHIGYIVFTSFFGEFEALEGKLPSPRISENVLSSILSIWHRPQFQLKRFIFPPAVLQSVSTTLCGFDFAHIPDEFRLARFVGRYYEVSHAFVRHTLPFIQSLTMKIESKQKINLIDFLVVEKILDGKS